MASDGQRQFVDRHAAAVIVTRISVSPATCSGDLDAPGHRASSAFSTSSLTTLAGAFDDLAGAIWVDRGLWEAGGWA